MNSIRLRLTAWYVIILGVILVLFSLTIYQAVKSRLSNEISHSVQSAAFEAEKLFNPNVPTLASLPEGVSTQNAMILTFNEPGRLVETSNLKRLLAFDAKAVTAALRQGDARVTRVDDARYGSLLVYTIPVVRNGQVVGAVQVARSLNGFQNTLWGLLVAFFVLIPVCLALAAAGGLFMSTKALSPIRSITSTAREISAHNLDERITVTTGDELGRLAETINDLLDRLEKSIESERRFIGDASHELRTPLTVLKGEMEVGLNRERSAAEYQELLRTGVHQIDEMSDLVDGLLTLARLEKGGSLDIEEINAKEFCEEIALLLERAHPEKTVAVLVDAPDDLVIRGDRMKLKRSLGNLIDNAVKFSPDGGTVRVSSALGPSSVKLTVADSGPGIGSKDLDLIFDRFYRGDEARSLGHGSGIGLSIAMLVAEAHGGTITVRSSRSRGSAFTLELPLA